MWQEIFDHPMVRALGDGTLDDAPFRYWVKQDYVFLIDYSRVFAFGAAKAPDLGRMAKFASLLHQTLNTEMDLHRAYAQRLGIPGPDLERTQASPTTQAYTDFLVRTASLDDFGALVAVLLPCMWGFNETGKRLAEVGRPEPEPYAEWVDMYSGDEFTRLTRWCRDLMDQVADTATPEARDLYQRLFLTSSRYELMFWEAAWRQEEWPA